MRETLTGGSIGGMPPAERDRRERVVAWELRAIARRHPRHPLSDEAIRDLARAICDWTPGGEYQRPARPEWKSYKSEVRFYHRLGADLDSVAERLARPGVSEGISNLVLGPGALEAWKRGLDQLRGLLRLFPSEPRESRGRRGPKVDHWRVRLAADCGDVLVDHGLPIARSRDGLFADVIAAALDAAGEPVPADIYDLVDQALSLMERDARSVLTFSAAATSPASKLSEALREHGEMLVPGAEAQAHVEHAKRVLASLRRRDRVVLIRKPRRK